MAITPTLIACPTLRSVTRTPIIFPTRSPTPNDGTARTGVGDDYFDPSALTIKSEPVVEWRHSGARAHSITSFEGKWLLIYPAFGSRYQMSFDIPGTFAFVRSFHPGIGGTIRVVSQ